MTPEYFLEKVNVKSELIWSFDNIKVWYYRFDKQFVDNILFQYLLDNKDHYIERKKIVSNLYSQYLIDKRDEKLSQLGI